jgi:protoporphyrinogen oxidase
MVADPDTVWLGLEYFCNENDDLWNLSDQDLRALAADELHKIAIVDRADVLDGTVVRAPKAYPAYFGSYDRFHELRQYLDGIDNLFLIGRNGMHRYNNQDHSMLTAMVAVDNILAGRTDKSNIWSVNTEQGYHETAERPQGAPAVPVATG